MLEAAAGGDLKDIWWDTFRSQCYATVRDFKTYLVFRPTLFSFPLFCQFETNDQATAARESVCGSQWPVVGGKILAADFASEKEATDAKEGLTPGKKVTA